MKLHEKKYRQIIFVFGAVIAGGAFFTFLTLSKTDSLEKALLIGTIYSVLVIGSALSVYRFTVLRFSIFPNIQRWLLKTILFFLAISFAYLLGLLFQTIILTPSDVLISLISDTIWDTFVRLVFAPFAGAETDPILSAEVRGIIFTVIAVLFLIGLISLIGSYAEVRWQDNRHHVLIDRAGLAVLRAQMEPHFLFNTLNTIAAKVREDPLLAENLILQLSDILRYHYHVSADQSADLDSEIEFARKYASLLTSRFGENLQIRFNINSKNGKAKIPVFLIQPLIENAIRHAWKIDNSPLHVDIEVNDLEQAVQINVSDNGAGIKNEILKKIMQMNHALSNLDERLRLFYNQGNLLRINSEENNGTQVIIKLPG